MRDAARLFDEDSEALLFNPEPGMVGRAQVQPLRHYQRQLGLPEWDGTTRYDCVQLLATPNRQETLEYMGLARRALNAGGQLQLSVENALGADGYRKRLAPAEVESKHKCKLLIYPAESLPDEGDPRQLRAVGEDFVSCPGLFSWDRLDPGSRLLLQHLPEQLKGAGADFGCGPGLLARELLKRGPDSLDVVDVDRRAVQAAEANCSRIQGGLLASPWDPPRSEIRGGAKVRALWLDLSEEKTGSQYDWVALNPPFHTGGKEQRQLGLRLLQQGLAHLKPKGELWLVANQDLPYEVALREWKAGFELVARTGGFKVLRCRRKG